MPVVPVEGRIVPSDLGPDTDLARRILVRARIIQPLLPTFGAGSDERADALAILKGVYARAAAVGVGAVASQSRNGTSISFREVKSAFADDDANGLRSLADATAHAASGLPRGSFPNERPLSRLWPETYP